MDIGPRTSIAEDTADRGGTNVDLWCISPGDVPARQYEQLDDFTYDFIVYDDICPNGPIEEQLCDYDILRNDSLAEEMVAACKHGRLRDLKRARLSVNHLKDSGYVGTVCPIHAVHMEWHDPQGRLRSDARSSCMAARHGRTDCLEFVLQLDACSRRYQVCVEAAAHRHEACLRSAWHLGCPMEMRVLYHACVGGHAGCVRAVHEFYVCPVLAKLISLATADHASAASITQDLLAWVRLTIQAVVEEDSKDALTCNASAAVRQEHAVMYIDVMLYLEGILSQLLGLYRECILHLFHPETHHTTTEEAAALTLRPDDNCCREHLRQHAQEQRRKRRSNPVSANVRAALASDRKRWNVSRSMALQPGMERIPILAGIAPSRICRENGLYARVNLGKGRAVTSYPGELMIGGRNECDAVFSAYQMDIDDTMYVDAHPNLLEVWQSRHESDDNPPLNLGGLAHVVNDPLSYPPLTGASANCVYDIDPQSSTVFLVTTRKVRAGEELLAEYGFRYWSIGFTYPERKAELRSRYPELACWLAQHLHVLGCLFGCGEEADSLEELRSRLFYVNRCENEERSPAAEATEEEGACGTERVDVTYSIEDSGVLSDRGCFECRCPGPKRATRTSARNERKLRVTFLAPSLRRQEVTAQNSMVRVQRVFCCKCHQILSALRPELPPPSKRARR